MEIDKLIEIAAHHRNQANFQDAKQIFMDILKVQPHNIEVLYCLSETCYIMNDLASAAGYLIKAIALDNNNADAFCNLGLIFYRQGQREKATECFHKALDINRENVQAYLNLGIIHTENENHDEAFACYKKAVQFDPLNAEAFNNLGILLRGKRDYDKAIECFKKSVRLNPGNADSYNNLGIALKDKGMVDEAISCYIKAIEKSPDHIEAHWNKALAMLLKGDYKEGWKEFEWRWKTKDFIPRNFKEPLWTGYGISGKTILLHAEKGFGDTIQFIRYAPLVAGKGATVILECQKELKSLLERTEGIAGVTAQGEKLPHFDVHCPLLSLPLVFKTDIDNVPAHVPYIHTDPVLAEKWRDRIHTDKSRLKTGLTWDVNREHKVNFRGFPPELFASISKAPDISFYSLQKNSSPEDINILSKSKLFFNFMDEIDDFSDTAALIESLDLVISVDTAVAHLAGALGKPVWLLLPYEPLFRWMLDREDSPWYPTMKLFRQNNPGDWQDVFNRIHDRLREITDNRV